MTNLESTIVPDMWNVGNSYRKGHQVSYKGFLYKCHLDHVSTASWSPNSAPLVWSLIGPLRIQQKEKASDEKHPYILPKYVQVPIPKLTQGNVIKQLRMNVTVTFTGDGHYTTAVTSSSATYI